MSALTKDAKGILALFQRSPKDADGWAKVSPMVWPLLKHVPDDLMAKEGNAYAGGRARLTENGKLIVAYTQ